MEQHAVIVQHAFKSYGKGQQPVLDGLNMTVQRGCIYALLGASGCGKTTLLSCIVGVRKLDQGEIYVLGGRPGQKGSGIPGPQVGYMPQEVSLIGEFSIIGALYYFGRINGLEDSDIKEWYVFLSDLLQLPPKDRLVKHLSGGQQRRVSFAASMIHKPELLILDEPTVGLDPVLRENIWQFLVKLTKEQGTAVVITTHYIEETKHADRIGLLRRGQLLEETTPTALLTKFSCQRLEEAFLILSQRQEDCKNRGVTDIRDNRPDMNTEELSTSHLGHYRNSRLLSNTDNQQSNGHSKEMKKQYSKSSSILDKIFKALMVKNFLQFSRNPANLIFAFLLPLLQTLNFFYSIGGDPKGIIVAVVNDEAGHCVYGRNVGTVIYNPDEHICDYIDVSCRFLHGFDDTIMTKQYFNTLEEATMAVKSGKAAGTMYFGQNFSQALQKRRDSFDTLADDEINASEIQTSLDMGDSEIGMFLLKNIYERFFQVHEEIVFSCNISKKFVAVPIFFEDPVYGNANPKFSEFVAPGFIVTLTYFLATAVSTSIIISDRAEGVWTRSLVQGVTTSVILFSHILTQMLIVVIQVAIVLIFTFAYFQLPCHGSFAMVIILVLLNGIGGMCYGFVISVICTSHWLANFVSTGSFLPLMLLSGVVWPLEGMPTFLRYVSYCLPTTIPSFALRGLLDKGQSIFEFEVYSGFCVAIVWIVIFFIICLIGLRRSA